MLDEYLISPGPGHIDRPNAPYGLGADVGLTLTYHNMFPSDTRAILHVGATNVEEGSSDVTIGMELTEGDLAALALTIKDVLAAIRQDDK